MNEHLGIYLGPLHDEHSHAAESFGLFAANCGLTLRDWPVVTDEQRVAEPSPQHAMRIPPPAAATPTRRMPL